MSSNNRTINIIISIAGLLLSVGGFMMAAPEGMLGNESISLFQGYQGLQQIIYFVIPAVLVAISCILVFVSKVSVVALIAAVAGGCIFGINDISFFMSGQAFPGILINFIGVILVITGACLQLFTVGKFSESEIAREEDIVRAVSSSSIYMTDVRSDSAGDIETIMAKYRDVELDDARSTQGDVDEIESIFAEPVKPVAFQEETVQSEASTDFYSGIEDIFIGNSKN